MMMEMKNGRGEKFALKFDPGHQQHGWIFYNNHETWVTLRKATDEEMNRAENRVGLQNILSKIPTH